MPKRARGTGSIYIKHGSWYGRWRDSAGRGLNRKLGPVRRPGERDGLTRAEAEKRLRALIDDRSIIAPVRVGVAEAGEAVMRRLEMRGAKRTYRMNVEMVLRVHLVPAFGSKELARITEEDVERSCAAKLRAGLSPKTVRNRLGVLHGLFKLGERRGWCVRNPVRLAEGPRVHRNDTRIRFLTQEELEALVRVDYPDDPLGSIEPTLYLTAAMTGLRQNELFALRWGNIDWVAPRIRVVDGYVRGVFNDPKSEDSARSVPLASRVAQALERLYQRSNWTGDDDLVFAHPALGTPLDSSRILKAPARS